MKTKLARLILPVLLATTPVVTLASPLPVKPVGTGAQIVTMCPKCGTPIACAKVGDYTLAFSAELLDLMPQWFVRLSVRVTDKAGAPVDNAKVSFAAWMKGHWHELTPPLRAESQGKGVYSGTTSRLTMRDTWYLEVRVVPSTGDTIVQQFTFTW